jgi:hypothetical protein
VNFNILPLGNAEIFIEFNGLSVNFAVDDFHDFFSCSSNPCSVELYAFVRKTSRNLLQRRHAVLYFADKRKTGVTVFFGFHPSAFILIVALRLLSQSVPKKKKSSVRMSSSILGQRSHSDSEFFHDKEVSRPVVSLGERLDDAVSDVFGRLHSQAKQNDTTTGG